MKKKLLSIAAACVLGVQAIAMPMIANAEQGTQYVTNSDFNDVSIGGAKGTGYYGLGIIMDGSPWLSKGSASVHYQTFYHDDQRNVNYCNFWSNSDKTGSGETGKVVGSLLDAAYQASIPSGVTGIKTTCWGYIRGNTYDFDLTNVTIGKSDTKYSAQ